MPHTVQCCPQHLLVVDDNADAVETLATVLAICGHSVGIAPSAEVALAKARVRRPDAMICDLAMPGVDGFAFARAVRQDPDLCRTRLIAVSAHHDKHDEALAAGFDSFEGKPADLRRLVLLLRPCGRGVQAPATPLAEPAKASAAQPFITTACSNPEYGPCVAGTATDPTVASGNNAAAVIEDGSRGRSTDSTQCSPGRRRDKA